MPTQHVKPGTEEHLGDVANALLKARKVVVVTGAGISTNSGIPDFRSENGLYSLIQAQFDAASRQARQDEHDGHDEHEEAADNARPTKRRKTSMDAINEPDWITVKVGPDDCQDALQDGPSLPQHTDRPELLEDSAVTAATAATQIVVGTKFRTPQSKTETHSSPDLSSSPPSSPPAEFMISPSTVRSHTHRRLTDAALPLSSSPLSSPPPILFDPFDTVSPSEASSGRRSSTSLSEVDETDSPPNSLPSSQNSAGSRSTLPNMKGKDLFDANIWSDPMRTSVFYTFATSLRQKIRHAEPTTSHRFISHLRDRGKLVRCYTQNIDQIEEKVGLSTRLQDGPGSRGRFSRRSTANMTQLNKMVEEAKSASSDKLASETSSLSDAPADSSEQSQPSSSDENNIPATDREPRSDNQANAIPKVRRELPRSGVECVFLHGSLDLLRCFLCGKVCSWDDDNRESETLSGQQPECPHCVGATAARQERGKRALGVGKLRPDIVLYGEEHPSSHLISPIITHDLSLYPDMLLILGTSLRVHGLKVMVREFAKAVHCKGGKVVFVNFTKPPDSIWGDIIDYWVQWDCDAWVTDLQVRIPKLWQELEPARPRRKRESSGTSEDSAREEKKKPPPANPVALRDTKVTGAYWTFKVLSELHRITGNLQPENVPARRASLSAGITAAGIVAEVFPHAPTNKVQKETKARQKGSRKSAPGALEKGQRRSSTLNPNHGRSRKKAHAMVSSQVPDHVPEPTTSPALTSVEPCSTNSILSSVKENARVRKRKKVDGEEIPAPKVGRRRGGSSRHKVKKDDLKLPPLQTLVTNRPALLYGKPQPLEPKSPPSGPLTSLSPNLRSAKTFQRHNAFFLDELLVGLHSAPHGHPFQNYSENVPPTQAGTKEEASAAFALAGLRTSPVMARTMPRKQIEVTAPIYRRVLAALIFKALHTCDYKRLFRNQTTVVMGHQEVLALRAKSAESPRPFGSEWKREFPFDPEWHNLNHGSFGTYPKHIRDRLRAYQDQAEARPDPFIFYEQPKRIDAAREELARLVHAPLDTVVFVGNATDGVNTVLRNLAWAEDGKDVILSFSTIYEACGKAADYLAEYFEGKLEHRGIAITYPLEDEEIIRAFRTTVKEIQDEGKRAKVCIFDVVSSRPGVVFPWMDMVKACKELGIISLVDGAQGIGMVHLDLTAADPDFFVSNCHKWLHVPRGCAVFYAPIRNQHLLRTTLATSHGFIPKLVQRTTPMPPSAKSAYVNNFEFVGTKDNGPYMCVKDAIEWRRNVCGGEDKIVSYLWDLNKKGIKLVADALGTTYLDNSKGTMTNCAMGNVSLPVWVSERGEGAKETDIVVPEEDKDTVFQWITETLVRDYRTFMLRFIMGNRYWIRISAQIYLDLADYEFAAKALGDICERIGKREYLK
ncbi:Sir2 family protein [Metarhizium robertsii ARSEF 23]|uniref:Sir2 family protein n=2 Tax=Metarhizium robertsii TaxID=568076 RepID=E9EZU6_METRA|nr:Sir2 family protein [Metarhizium robertsii ARSEF 23]EFY99487.1 Sir2 family protein [Metarhizium robertsii ARSEF 23]